MKGTDTRLVRLYKLSEVRKALNMNRQTLYSKIRAGTVKVIRLEGSNQLRITAEEFSRITGIPKDKIEVEYNTEKVHK